MMNIEQVSETSVLNSATPLIAGEGFTIFIRFECLKGDKVVRIDMEHSAVFLSFSSENSMDDDKFGRRCWSCGL